MNDSNPQDPQPGKPPKSAERIRAALESVHTHRGPVAPAGPRSKGAQPDDPIVVASFHDPAVGRKYQERLLQFGIRDLMLLIAMIALSLVLWRYGRWVL